MDLSIYKDYYLLKCFPNEEYRKALNNGDKIHMFSTAHYHNEDNEFTKDFEGGVFKQDKGSKSAFVITKKKIDVNEAIRLFSERDVSNARIIDITDFKVHINGYISCFVLIHKSLIGFGEKDIIFNENNNISTQLYNLLNKYAISNGYAFLCFYDAENVLTTLCSHIEKMGYSFYCAPIDYMENFDYEKRIKLVQKNDIFNLLFTKDKKFEYQREFRVFINKVNDKNEKDYIELSGVNLSDSIVNELVYLTPEYVKKHWG